MRTRIPANRLRLSLANVGRRDPQRGRNGRPIHERRVMRPLKAPYDPAPLKGALRSGAAEGASYENKKAGREARPWELAVGSWKLETIHPAAAPAWRCP